MSQYLKTSSHCNSPTHAISWHQLISVEVRHLVIMVALIVWQHCGLIIEATGNEEVKNVCEPYEHIHASNSTSNAFRVEGRAPA